MIITQTPVRISFLGGGTDYPEYFQKFGGAVLGTAIDKYAILSINRFFSELFDYSIRISYRQVETVGSIDELKHSPFRECLRWSGISRDVEINYAAELPANTGLGSSSTFVVGLLHTLYAYQGRLVTPIELAYEAIDLERRVLGEAVGCQDQTFAACGGFNLIEFRDLDNIIVNRIPLNQGRLENFQDHLMLFFTGIKRRANDFASRQVKNVDLNLPHLHAIRKSVDEGASILMNCTDLCDFGRLLHKTWLHKRELDPGMSNSTIDGIYQAGLEAGAVGGKLLGAGGGGFILFFVPPEKHNAVRSQLNHLTEIPVRINAPGAHVIHA